MAVLKSFNGWRKTNAEDQDEVRPRILVYRNSSFQCQDIKHISRQYPSIFESSWYFEDEELQLTLLTYSYQSSGVVFGVSDCSFKAFNCVFDGELY